MSGPACGPLGLVLRTRTCAHLYRISRSREYLSVRYGPRVSGKFSDPTSLAASLSDLNEKVGKAIGTKP